MASVLSGEPLGERLVGSVELARPGRSSSSLRRRSDAAGGRRPTVPSVVSGRLGRQELVERGELRSGAQVTTTRVGASPKSATSAAQRAARGSVEARRRATGGGAAVSAPPSAPLAMQHSARATARPPSAQSWALLSRPARDAVAQHALELHLELQVDVGHAALDAAVVHLLVLGAVEPGGGGRAQQRRRRRPRP